MYSLGTEMNECTFCRKWDTHAFLDPADLLFSRLHMGTRHFVKTSQAEPAKENGENACVRYYCVGNDDDDDRREMKGFAWIFCR